MDDSAQLACRCGKVRGVVALPTEAPGHRLLCYCRDCRAFVRWLGDDDALDNGGGVDLFQTAPSRVQLQDGSEHLGLMRLSEKGLFRIYATCCRTPVLNTLGPRFPLVALYAPFLAPQVIGRARDEQLGVPLVALNTASATGLVPHGPSQRLAPLVGRILRNLPRWWLAGFSRRPPLADRLSALGHDARVLRPEERAALSA